MSPRLILSLLLAVMTMPQNARTAQPERKALAIYAPHPIYPRGAQYRRSSGAGIFLLRTKISTGRVTQVIIARSTGDRFLDGAAVKALREWQFKPESLSYWNNTSLKLNPPLTKQETLIKVPVRFSL
jgi:TonB family protein